MRKLTRAQMKALLDLATQQPEENRSSMLQTAIEKLADGIEQYDRSRRRSEAKRDHLETSTAFVRQGE